MNMVVAVGNFVGLQAVSTAGAGAAAIAAEPQAEDWLKTAAGEALKKLAEAVAKEDEFTANDK